MAGRARGAGPTLSSLGTLSSLTSAPHSRAAPSAASAYMSLGAISCSDHSTPNSGTRTISTKSYISCDLCIWLPNAPGPSNMPPLPEFHLKEFSILGKWVQSLVVFPCKPLVSLALLKHMPRNFCLYASLVRLLTRL